MEDVATIANRIQGVPHAFADNARVRRVALGYSQEYVSLQMAVHGIAWHQTVLAKIESEQRAVKLGEAYALAQMYDIGLEDLINGVGLDEVDAYVLSSDDGETRTYTKVRQKVPRHDGK